MVTLTAENLRTTSALNVQLEHFSTQREDAFNRTLLVSLTMSSMVYVHHVILALRLLTTEDVQRPKHKREIPIAKLSEKMFALNVQEVPFLILLEFVSQ